MKQKKFGKYIQNAYICEKSNTQTLIRSHHAHIHFSCVIIAIDMQRVSTT